MKLLSVSEKGLGKMNFFQKIILFAIIAVMLCTIAEAKYYAIDLEKEGSAIKAAKVYVLGGDAAVPSTAGKYELVLKSFTDEDLLSFNFDIADKMHLEFPYYGNAKSVFIYYLGNALTEINVGYFADVCGDNVCQSHESYYSCPKDCDASSADGFCNAVLDGVCDPDCHKNDTDCRIEAIGRETRVIIIIVAAIIAALVVIAVLIYIESRKIRAMGRKLSVGQKLQLDNYIASTLKKGYKRQQISKVLLKEGWPQKQIDEAFKRTER